MGPGGQQEEGYTCRCHGCDLPCCPVMDRNDFLEWHKSVVWRPIVTASVTGLNTRVAEALAAFLHQVCCLQHFYTHFKFTFVILEMMLNTFTLFCCEYMFVLWSGAEHSDSTEESNPGPQMVKRHQLKMSVDYFLSAYDITKQWQQCVPSSSGRYLLSMASLIWLLAPLGSRSIAQLKFIRARWVCPSFLYTWGTGVTVTRTFIHHSGNYGLTVAPRRIALTSCLISLHTWTAFSDDSVSDDKKRSKVTLTFPMRK